MLQKNRVNLLFVVLLLVLSSCHSLPYKMQHETMGSSGAYETAQMEGHIGFSGVRSSEKNIEEAYKWNKSKSIVVAVINDKAEDGPYTLGSCTGNFSVKGMKGQYISCQALEFYNYERLRNVADADETALYHYFNIGIDWFWGGQKVAERYRSISESLFTGDLTNEWVEAFNNANNPISYVFYIDWENKGKADVGDTVLAVVDPQLTVNPNSLYSDSHIKNPRSYQIVIAPFSEDHPEPYIAHFIDGKLQLSKELEDAFALRRLYDDTDPELTGIKDGDAIEDVVAFLKAVEQDMIRYEEEMRQQPITTDVSSIR